MEVNLLKLLIVMMKEPNGVIGDIITGYKAIQTRIYQEFVLLRHQM